jgi:hypothetical protein
MKKPSLKLRSREMRAEYDFSGGVRGKHGDRYRQGTNVVLLDPELAEAFPDSKSVNDALRALATRVEIRKRHDRDPREADQSPTRGARAQPTSPI